MASAMPVKWHMGCLEQWERNLANMEQQLALMQVRLRQQQKAVRRYELQINEAIRLGKDKFDSQLFLKKRFEKEDASEVPL